MQNPLPLRLKSARKLANLTQEQLGKLLGFEGTSASARLSQYESGKHAPDFGTAKRIAQALDVPVAFLYCDDDNLAQLILSYGKLTPEAQAELIKLISSKAS